MGETYMEMENFALAREYFSRALDYPADGAMKKRIYNLLRRLGPD